VTTPSCDSANLCLDVASIRPGTTPHAGRLVLAWLPSSTGGVLQVAYDVAFAGTETQVAIPLASITAPNDQAVTCTRNCADPATCPCTGTFKMAFGMILVVQDANGDGKAGTDETVLGLSQDANVVYSAIPLNPVPPGYTWDGRPMSEAFPSGIQQGSLAYVGSQTLTPAAAGTRFKLQVCDSTNEAECKISTPY
jgi:hypothetical protein